MGAKPASRNTYRKHVLNLQVPVAVTIARKTMPLSQVLQLVPGSMINFQQLCDEPLQLEVCGHEIGRGTAVKIGDKFGLKLALIHTHKPQ